MTTALKKTTTLALGTLTALSVISIAGCGNWVDVKPQARNVAILDSSQIANCQFLGKANVSVLTDAGFLPRKKQTINADLVNLARNEAANQGGNAVAPLTKRHDGHQTFGIYQCHLANITPATPTQAGHPTQGGLQSMPYKSGR